ncbi:MAG: ornithine cyclodeaminase family protein [Firmicutes bacterium]|nr:ornithine cyclodeaminase family protein [Bacillota bacterium]
MEITVLSRKNLEKVLEMPKVIEGVKSVYKLKSQGDTAVWPLVEHHFEDKKAVMDIRSGGVFGDINLHGLKMLNNFPQNAQEGLPVFTGMLMVFDSNTGMPLGVMDASYITCMRTGAAGAIGTQALARPDSEVLFVLGAGKQAIFQIAATLITMPQLRKVYIADPLNKENAEAFAAGCYQRLKEDFNVNCPEAEFVPVSAEKELQDALAETDIVITITPARKPAIKKEWIKPGTHFSCIGADMVGKEEIDPELFADAGIFADDISQCMRVGEMEIPIKTGVITQDNIAGEIGQVLAGNVAGRRNAEEITIFDATGLALLDLVTAKAAIELASEKGLGTKIEI